MKDVKTYTGKLEVVQRLDNSFNGNPRYQFTVGGVAAITQADCSYGYSITNFDGKMVKARIGTHYHKLMLDRLELLPS